MNYDEGAQHLVIDGDTRDILKNRLVFAFVQKFRGEKTSDTRIVIPTMLDELEVRYQGLQKVLERHDTTFILDDDLSGALAEVNRRSELFNDFSRQAAEIWKGNVNKEDFSKFVSSLKDKCPGRTFYARQLLSAYHLAFSQHTCNFSVPGSGKTSVIYAAFAYLNSLTEADDKFVNHILVVGPLSSFKAWEDEFIQIFGREPRARRISGVTNSNERKAYLRGYGEGSKDAELTLTSYHTLSSSERDFETFLKWQSRRVMMVIDEAHNIKKTDGVWASASLRLSMFADSRVVLTGTPAPNGYEDLVNLFGFIYPNRNIIGFNTAALKLMSSGKMERGVQGLKERINPFFTRIKKSDLDLPKTNEDVIEVQASQAQEEIYRYIEDAFMPALEQQVDSVSSFLNRARLVRLRQAATNPGLLLRPLSDEGFTGLGMDKISLGDVRIVELIKTFKPEDDLAKLKALKDLIAKLRARHEKILVWSIFINNLDLISTNVAEMADQVHVICGRTPVQGDEELPEDLDIETRERIIENFLHHEGSSILIANPQAIGESISLHQACHVAIYFDRDFNAGRFIQSKDRIHRYGLKPGQVTEYYYLATADTVDIDIHTRVAEKELRLSKLIDDEDIPLFRLVLGESEDHDDLKAIIASYERRKLSG